MGILFGHHWVRSGIEAVGILPDHRQGTLSEVMEVGMVVDLLLPTIYRKGVGGPRVTDVVLVGEQRNEILTDYPRQLIRK